MHGVTEGYEAVGDRLVLKVGLVEGVPGVGDVREGGPRRVLDMERRAVRVVAHERSDHDEVDSIESIGDQLLAPTVKDVVGGTPRGGGGAALHHSEEKSHSEQDLDRVSLDQIVVDASGELVILEPPIICDACTYCEDTCRVPSCRDCAAKRAALEAGPIQRRRASFTLCEIRRHRTLASCWLVAKGQVFDVTSYLQRHPAGAVAIARKAGGRDCTEDLGFHSAGAQKLWKDFRIGTVKPCTRYPLDKTTMVCSKIPSCDEGAICAVM